jgi:hypothetical protein
MAKVEVKVPEPTPKTVVLTLSEDEAFALYYAIHPSSINDYRYDVQKRMIVGEAERLARAADTALHNALKDHGIL